MMSELGAVEQGGVVFGCVSGWVIGCVCVCVCQAGRLDVCVCVSGWVIG